MTDTVTRDNVLDRLARVQSLASLPDSAKKTAERLIAQLSSPVRFALLGPPGAGKSTLLNVLAGAPVVPPELRLPTAELQCGATDRIIATLGDGTTKEIAGLDFENLQSLSPVFAEIRTSLPTLKEISFLEVVTDGTPEEMMAATKWAAGRTEIAIWVTTEFSLEERALWAKLPDTLKDHGYLVFNQFDKLSAHDRVEYANRLKVSATQGFRSGFQTSALQGLAALDDHEGPDQEALKTSGCQALKKALMRDVDLGTQADIDGALLFLNRFESPVAKATASGNKVRSKKPGTMRVNPSRDAADATEGPDTLQIEAVLERQVAPDSDARRDARNLALAHVQAKAEAMLDQLRDSDGSAAEYVLGHCADTVEELTDKLSDDDSLFDPVMQANDIVVLLQLEQTEAAAEDAVVALLQLKRDIELVATG